ncbi:hypothetical protein [Actinomadura sp. WMMA1423]|uniref:hypothetical protein n=1 Tax=Actinomadura sp. WMMA1423 TaxID=2591108 RepID=UPI00143DAC9E|nr:hypothetical protein [Actinomadura sp. WMMA1423]
MADLTDQERKFASSIFKGAADLCDRKAKQADTPQAAEEAEIEAAAYRGVAEAVDSGEI